MSKDQKKELIRILAGLIFFVTGLFIKAEPLQTVLYLLSWFVCGYPVLWEALQGILHLELLDENFLMSVASVGAIALGETMEAAVVMLLYSIGEMLEERAENHAKGAISEMLKLHPQTVTLLKDGQEVKVPPEEAKAGDVLIVRGGERVGLDGMVIKGTATLDASALTGESLPITAEEGDHVRSGCICLDGMLTIQAEVEFTQSTVAKIIALMKSSAEKKAHTERFITRFARIYTPAVCLAALSLFLIPVLFLRQNVQIWGYRALSFLVVSCPCALVISVPLSFFGGIGAAGKRGILVKGGESLEALSKTGIMLFDKTGTLTQGKFQVIQVHPSKGTGTELVHTAAAVESASRHPISRSVCAYTDTPVQQGELSEVNEEAGKGISAVWQGRHISAGNEAYMRELGITPPFCEHAETVVHTCADGEYLGHLVIADSVKPTAKQALQTLRTQGIRTQVMLTGDREPIAREICRALNMDIFYAGLLPHQKLNKLDDMMSVKRPHETLAFVGDGMNDAPVLAAADVGIAMGGMGSDAAIEAADIVLMDDDPQKLCESVRIAKRTCRIALQNIVGCLLIKIMLLILSALGKTPMWLSVFGDVGVCLLAIANATRALTPGGTAVKSADSIN